MTTPASYRDKNEWRLARQDGLGGSNASEVVGISPWRTPMDVYLEKTGELKPEELSWRMRWGNIGEAVAADLYAGETGRKIRQQPLRRHPEYPFLIANVDRQILAGTAGVTSTGCLEIKSPSLGNYSKMKARGLPDYAVIQLQHYLGVLGYSWGSFAIFNPEDGPPIHFDMEADQGLIADLFEREIKFWTEHVVPRIPPPMEPTSKPLDIPQVEGELITVDSDEWVKAATEFREARELKDTATELEETAKAKVQELMHRDELHAAEVPGLVRFYYKWMTGNTKWKETAAALAREAQLSVDDFIVKGEGFKRFSTYLLKGSRED